MTAMGDNSSKAERERRVSFSYYHRKDRDIAAKIRELNEQKKSNRQNAKAAGFPAQKLDHYLKSFLAEDQQKPVDKLRSEKENLAWLGYIHEDPQGDLLSNRVGGEQLVQAKGFHAGLNGLDRVSGYDAGHADDRLWLESYDAGAKEYETVLPDFEARIKAEADKEAPPAPDDDDWNNAAPTGRMN